MAALAVLSSCGTKEKLEQAQEQNTALNTELQATLATQDSLFALINDITTGMNQIKDIEHIIATPGALTDESSSRKTQLRNDMVAIREALQQRRERLAQLEAKLKESNGSNATLLKTIDNLKGQIAEQETEIATLTNQLSAAHVEMPPCSEEIAIADDNIYVVFESASRKYFEGTDGNGASSSPIDKVLEVTVASIW